MMRVELNDREVQILDLRKRAVTFKEIANLLGFNHYQQAQAIYRKALKKLRRFHYLQKHDPQLIKAAEANGFGFTQLSRLFSILEREGIEAHYKDMDLYSLSEINGIGGEYLKILEDSKFLS